MAVTTFWSMSSSVAGTSPAATMADTTLPASSREGKTASMVLSVSGLRRMRRMAAVTMPKVPSLPMKAPRRSRPGGSAFLPPNQTISPSGSTTSRPSTWLEVTPYLKQCGPPAFSAMLPPTEEAFMLAGSGA